MKKNKNFKKNKAGNTKKIILVVAALVLLSGVASASYLTLIKDDPVAINQEEQQKSAEEADVSDAKQKAEEENNNVPLKETEEEQQEPADTVGVVLSNLSFSQVDHMINSSVQISGAAAGKCKFTFTDTDGRALVRSVSPTQGSCSVSVSEAEFTLLGTWSLRVEYGGKIVSRSVEIS